MEDGKQLNQAAKKFFHPSAFAARHSTASARRRPSSILHSRLFSRMNISYRLGWLGFRAIYRFYFRRRFFNAERVPLTGAVILASNHASFLDPPLVGSGLHRPINYLARESLFRFPGIGALLRSWQAVPVDRDGGGAAGLKAILARLLAGGAIILFPEGTRTRDGKLQPARSGIGLVVIKSDAPVVPVRTFGTFEAYGRHITFPRPKPVAVKYGQPMKFEQLRAEAKNCSKVRLKEIYQQIANEIMAAIAELEPGED
jgi:1-acyl-sn-glycerol-3-phosphate acyltransferase